MKLIDHRKFFAFVVGDAIKLTNDRDADIFASWKVGGQDFYIYGKAVEGSVCSPCVEVAGTPGDCVPPAFGCRPVCAVYRDARTDQVRFSRAGNEAMSSEETQVGADESSSAPDGSALVESLRDTHRHIEELERIQAESPRCVMTHEAKERAKMLTERIIALSQNNDLSGRR